MLARQTSDECSDDYRVQPGDPCVPTVAGRQTCDDIDATNIVVVGTDAYGLDGDDDGVACDEDGPLGAVTTTVPSPPAAESSDLVATARVLGLLVVSAWLVAVLFAALYVWSHNHRQATGEEERRNNLGAISMFLAGAALSTLSAIALGILRWA